jgi:hypothetical protein
MEELAKSLGQYGRLALAVFGYTWSTFRMLFRRGSKEGLRTRIQTQPLRVLGVSALVLFATALVYLLGNDSVLNPITALLVSNGALNIIFAAVGIVALFALWLWLFRCGFLQSLVPLSLLLSLAMFAATVSERIFNSLAPIVAPSRYATLSDIDQADFDKALKGEVTYATLAYCIPPDDLRRGQIVKLYEDCFGPTWTSDLAKQFVKGDQAIKKKAWCDAIDGVGAVNTKAADAIGTITRYGGLALMALLPFGLVALNLTIHPAAGSKRYRLASWSGLALMVLLATHLYLDHNFSGEPSYVEQIEISKRVARERICDKVLTDWPDRTRAAVAPPAR